MRAAFVALYLVAACAQDSGTVMGVVTAVDGDLTSVRSFTLLVEGDSITFTPAEDGAFEYPLTHLRDHLRDGSPVRVSWERKDDLFLAIAVGDP
ncbi:MAG: hypothetical protein ACR2ME_01815 [Acidimicrobiia bacterium]